MVDDLTIKCKYSASGCDKTFKVSELRQHSDSCTFYPVVCPNQGCDFVGPRYLMTDHTPICEFKTEICQRGC